MPIPLEDEARLPPMTPHDEVVERKRLEDLRKFRRYLVDAGVAKCLVKMYQHTAKHEMRMDNPTLVKNFLAEYRVESATEQEIARLDRENATLREYNQMLAVQAEELAEELQDKQRLAVARELYHALTTPAFWDTRTEAGQELTITMLYRRLCGSQVDRATDLVLVDLVRPPALDAEAGASAVTEEAFNDWMVRGMAEDLRVYCRDGLLPRLRADPQNSPFEEELVKAIREESGLYPDHLDDVAALVSLEKGALEFVEAVVDHFKGLQAFSALGT